MTSIGQKDPNELDGNEADELAEDGDVHCPKHPWVKSKGPKAARYIDGGEEYPDVDAPAIYNGRVDHQKDGYQVDDNPHSEEIVGGSHRQEIVIWGGLGLLADCERREKRNKKG